MHRCPRTQVLVLGYAGSMEQGKISIGPILGWLDKHELSTEPLLIADVETQPGFSGAPVVKVGGGGWHRARQELEDPNLNYAYLIPSTSAAAMLAGLGEPPAHPTSAARERPDA